MLVLSRTSRYVFVSCDCAASTFPLDHGCTRLCPCHAFTGFYTPTSTCRTDAFTRFGLGSVLRSCAEYVLVFAAHDSCVTAEMEPDAAKVHVAVRGRQGRCPCSCSRSGWQRLVIVSCTAANLKQVTSLTLSLCCCLCSLHRRGLVDWRVLARHLAHPALLAFTARQQRS